MMPLDLVQDGLVTLVALAAGAVVFHRVLGFVRREPKAGCGNCPSANGGCATPTPDRAASDPTSHPIVRIRPSSR